MRGEKKGVNRDTPPRGVEIEVLENVTHYVLRQFIGAGQWDIRRADTLTQARDLQREMGPRAMIYAVGPIPSRGGQEGMCFVR